MIDCPECEICCAIQLCCPAGSEKQRKALAFTIQQHHKSMTDAAAYAAADRVLEHYGNFADVPRLVGNGSV